MLLIIMHERFRPLRASGRHGMGRVPAPLALDLWWACSRFRQAEDGSSRQRPTPTMRIVSPVWLVVTCVGGEGSRPRHPSIRAIAPGQCCLSPTTAYRPAPGPCPIRGLRERL